MTRVPRSPARGRSVRVAPVQAISVNGAPEANLAGAVSLVAEAAAGGAELVVCPEFLAPGYLYAEAAWDAAEPRGGRSERWLLAQSARHGLMLGAGWLEADGGGFANTFTMAGPDGIMVGARRPGPVQGARGPGNPELSGESPTGRGRAARRETAVPDPHCRSRRTRAADGPSFRVRHWP